MIRMKIVWTFIIFSKLNELSIYNVQQVCLAKFNLVGQMLILVENVWWLAVIINHVTVSAVGAEQNKITLNKIITVKLVSLV